MHSADAREPCPAFALIMKMPLSPTNSRKYLLNARALALAVLAWRSEDRRRALLRLGLALPIAAAYPVLLAIWIGEPLAFLRAQDGIWQRSLSWAGPLGGLWDGVAVLFADRPARDLALNLQQLGFTLALLALGVAAWRRFGAPYGVFVLASLAIPLTWIRKPL